MRTLSWAQLSLELNASQALLRDLLRDADGIRPDDTDLWLDSSAMGALRAHVSRSGVTSEKRIWTLEIGDTVRRSDLHAAYGGQQQGGIITPRSIPDILIVTSPESGSRHGYDAFEGPRADGTFHYTGEGQQGPQQFVRGNAALREAEQQGRPIRLFAKQGSFVTYIGEFTTGEPPYRREVIPDSVGNPRDGIIFHLVPVSANLEALTSRVDDVVEKSYTSSWTPPEFAPFAVDEVPATSDRFVSRLEFALQTDFGKWIQGRGETPKRLRLYAAGAFVEPDLYVEESGWIVEAKKSSARAYVRTAIGQVLDYALLAREAGRLAVPVILLPGRPGAHLEALLAELGIVLIVRSSNGFTIVA